MTWRSLSQQQTRVQTAGKPKLVSRDAVGADPCGIAPENASLLIGPQ
jgi:hypothetical protein